MKNRNSLGLGTALAAVLILASTNTSLWAEDKQPSSQSADFANIPTPDEARAALMAPISKQPSTGDVLPAATSGTGPKEPNGPAEPNNANASAEPQPSGPIGSFGQTIPAKFSKRNDILDHVPIMAWPLPLSDQQRKQIYDAVMAEKSQPVAGADALKPSSELSPSQALSGMHPLPTSVRGIDGVTTLYYVKAKDKVLLIDGETRTVVAQITS
ncbi:MAG TPA: hypothetical protein VKD19_11380 [Pseudolabrys sp.]|nr:hypothetical protein [Pseudolabrys sp.]